MIQDYFHHVNIVSNVRFYSLVLIRLDRCRIIKKSAPRRIHYRTLNIHEGNGIRKSKLRSIFCVQPRFGIHLP